MRRLGLVTMGIAATLVLGTSSVEAGKARRVDSEGVVYVLNLPPRDGRALSLQIEPGRTAWLNAAWGAQNHGTARMGHGLRWSLVNDTRRGQPHAWVYLEAEPLTGSFLDATKAYRKRLRALWAHDGKSLDRVMSSKETKRLKVGKKRVAGWRFQMNLSRKSDGGKMPAETVLFPLNGYLVALTAAAVPDYVKSVIKSLKVVPATPPKKQQVQHVIDTCEGTTTLFVFTPPKGYRLEPVVPGESDRKLVARWRRAKDQGPPDTLTLQRFTTMRGDARSAVEHWCHITKSKGGKTGPIQTLEIDGVDSTVVVWDRPAEDGKPPLSGWLAAWQSGTVIYACFGETEATGDAKRLQAEVAAVAEGLSTWQVH